MNIDDAILLAYVDGELPAQDHAHVEQAVRESAEMTARVSLLRASQLPYNDVFDQQTLPPLPESLSRNVDDMIRRHLGQQAAEETVKPAASVSDAAHGAANDAAPEYTDAPLGANVHRLKPRASQAAGSLRRLRPSWPTFAVAFAAGVFCCAVGLRWAPTLYGGGSGGSGGLVAASNDSGMAAWIRAAAGYQQLYSRDTIALLQPDAHVTAMTVSEIRDDDKLAMQIPDLSSQGLTFKRVQRLRFHDKPLVQIVYLPQKGKPVALCVLKEAKADAAPSSDNLDGMAVVAWRRGQLGYALIGEAGSVDLDALGKQLYSGQVSTTISATGVETHRG